jgi:hypothetical protein
MARTKKAVRINSQLRERPLSARRPAVHSQADGQDQHQPITLPGPTGDNRRAAEGKVQQQKDRDDAQPQDEAFAPAGGFLICILSFLTWCFGPEYSRQRDGRRRRQ